MKNPISNSERREAEKEADGKRRFALSKRSADADEVLSYLEDLAGKVNALDTALPESATQTQSPPVDTVAAPPLQVTPDPVSTPLPETAAANAEALKSAGGTGHISDILAGETQRIMRVLEEEAESARSRIEHEMQTSHQEAEQMVAQARADSERIRDHSQRQARALLSEVEEILSEAQKTGQQMLAQADSDAADIRASAAKLLSGAQEEARKIVEQARRDGEQILTEQRRLATVRAQESMREQDRLKDQIRRLEERRRQVIESLEPLINQLSQMLPTDRNVVSLPLDDMSHS